jgi:hypothetical protein
MSEEPLIVTKKLPAEPPSQLPKDHASVHGPTTLNCPVSPEEPVCDEVNVIGLFTERGPVVAAALGDELVTEAVQSQASLFTFRLKVPESP